MKDKRDRTIGTFRCNFDAVTRHFGHSDDAKDEAWAVAMQHPNRAAKCYEAIVRSFGPAPSELRRE